ncbi:hypothetical protein DUNSADRAFT_12531 [Dunaliella salina]|uniref:Uncharacterized protein n=1 Tax=Dunaliella salina TaxID=3046 RepID=A0ABQ7GB67_DUNSA|nr:hypothetical protein DUNSADRAFT_12531 [Dunaliella salina]|eukprot:KAF5831844.1 hypothetical protein DUNSADRAFT_12531 [Dunaliella salina]
MLRAFSMRCPAGSGTRAVTDVAGKFVPVAHQPIKAICWTPAPVRSPLSTNAAAEPATTQPARERAPSVPLYKGQQMSEAVSAAEGHIAGPGFFQLAVRSEPQANGAMRLLQNLAASQKQAGKTMEVRWISMRRRPDEQQQQQQQQPRTFNFRHLLVCQAAEPRTPVPEKEIRVSAQSQHREIALRAYDVLKEEAIKPAALPTCALTAIGVTSHVQAFKVIHTLRVMLRNIKRGLVVQLDTHKAPNKNEDGTEVLGLRYNIFLEELPETSRPSDNGNQ